MIYPQRQLDPYDENEVKGTRMPDYSKLAKDRDIYGELGWISNFNVKFSKNNHKLHPCYREFFDGPKNYHNQFNNSTMTNSEFFRQNAPLGSVAKSPSGMRSQASSIGFKSFQGRRSNSNMDELSRMGGSAYATPFVLEKDPNNRHRVDMGLQKSMEQSSQIPFLRDHTVKNTNFSKTSHGTFMGNVIGTRSHSINPNQQRKHRVMKRREQGWDNYIKPISKYNEQVHSSMRVPFENI